MKRIPADELTRLAFVWAEQDRASLAECWPAGSKERAEAKEEARQLREYRLKKWGRTKMEAIVSKSVSVDPLSIKGQQ